VAYRKCLNDALLLTTDCTTNLKKLAKIYNDSIQCKHIDLLQIRIKNTLENLRSALDFCAQAMVMKFADSRPKKVYFPYAALNTPKEKFDREQKIEKALPNLREKNPDLYSLIYSMQHFNHEGLRWFPEFMDLNNKNKHVYLVPGKIVEGVTLKQDGLTIISEGILITESGSINTSSGVTKGPIRITPDNVENFASLGIAKIEYWEAIFIEGYGFPMNAHQFVSHCVIAIDSVVKLISEKID